MTEKSFIEDDNAFDDRAGKEAGDFIFGVSGDEITGETYEIGGQIQDFKEFDRDTMSGWHVIMCTRCDVVKDYISKSSGNQSMKVELDWKVVSPEALGAGIIHPEKEIPYDDPAADININYDTYYVMEKTYYQFNKLMEAVRMPFRLDPNRKQKNGKPMKIWQFDPEKLLYRCVVATIVPGTKNEKRINADGTESYVTVPSGYPEIHSNGGRRTIQPVYTNEDEWKQCVGSDMPF